MSFLTDFVVLVYRRGHLLLVFCNVVFLLILAVRSQSGEPVYLLVENGGYSLFGPLLNFLFPVLLLPDLGLGHSSFPGFSVSVERLSIVFGRRLLVAGLPPVYPGLG